eukprot:1138286-Pelagomonas_calceolata.AAC.1
MPAHMLAVIKNLYENDEYVLVDGLKQAAMSPTKGVKQGCPLSFLLFALYINDIDRLAEGVEGAVTGTEGVRVTHMLYANDLSFTTNRTDQMQCMLDKLRGYAARKGSTVLPTYITAVGFETTASTLRTIHPAALNPAEQHDFFCVALSWLHHVGPLPQPPPTARQVKRTKDKAKKRPDRALSPPPSAEVPGSRRSKAEMNRLPLPTTRQRDGQSHTEVAANSA